MLIYAYIIRNHYENSLFVLASDGVLLLEDIGVVNILNPTSNFGVSGAELIGEEVFNDIQNRRIRGVLSHDQGEKQGDTVDIGQGEVISQDPLLTLEVLLQGLQATLVVVLQVLLEFLALVGLASNTTVLKRQVSLGNIAINEVLPRNDLVKVLLLHAFDAMKSIYDTL